MKKTLSEIDEMSLDEYFLWIAYARIHPFDDPWRINALNCQTIASCAGNKNIKMEDFMPKFNNIQTEEQMKLILQGAYVSNKS